ncbi:hypothetical protein PMIN01_07405 [Paraphaeosphaeria minitans]|uniref:Uncharacterized protein n=1 Tax=Paraphaeosphaeria minitans TaxID=565426 RepID=A0A9P6GF80_9PLEO|nr:hypothetical protein PMIN01_07405 [Paraphaeosphaeria minitans]
MEQADEPKRIILRFRDQYELEEEAIKNQYFALYGPAPPANDYFAHLVAPNESSTMHIILDIHCKSHPIIDNSKLLYEVFKVRKNKGFNFEKLSNAACDYARARCERTRWGTNRSQSEELDGVRPMQVGQSPATFVS